MPLPATERARKIIARCREIAACTEVPGETTRTFLAPSMHSVHTLFRGWMEEAGMSVWIDAIGNLRADTYPRAALAQPPKLIIGSHLDTVPNAGAFDGILGVVLGLALVEELQDAHLPFAIEIVGFSEEEGVRFGKPYLGSTALAGKFNAETLERTDAEDISIDQAVRNFGLNPAEIPLAVLNEDAFAYLEVHIEQGPLLESEGLQLGVVTAIVGQTRMQLRFSGQSNHAGTTPMYLRHDAMAAAAEWICETERIAKSSHGLVATVGRVQTRPGAGNVIAGEVRATLDVRHADDATRVNAASAIMVAATKAAEARGVQLSILTSSDEDAVPTDLALSRLLFDAAELAGSQARMMSSGAGHDARIIAEVLPAAMLFLRSPGGLSHHPDESVLVEDVEAALATTVAFVKLMERDTGFIHKLRSLTEPDA